MCSNGYNYTESPLGLGCSDAIPKGQPLLHMYSDTLETEHFPVPSGIAGTAFVHELSHLFSAYATGYVLEPVVLRAAMTMCALLLQKLSCLSKSKDHIACLERCIEPWRAWDLYELLQEGLTIQHRLINSKRKSCSEAEKISNDFVKMSEGNTKAAFRLLSKCDRGSILRLSDIVPSPEGAHASVFAIL